MPNLWPVFPYTNFHQLNLDWILKKVKELDTKVNEDIEEIIMRFVNQHLPQYLQNYIDAHASEYLLEATYQENMKQITMEIKNL